MLLGTLQAEVEQRSGRFDARDVDGETGRGGASPDTGSLEHLYLASSLRQRVGDGRSDDSSAEDHNSGHALTKPPISNRSNRNPL